MVTNIDEGVLALEAMYSPRKLSLMGVIKSGRCGGVNHYIAKCVIIDLCLSDEKFRNNVSPEFLLEILLENPDNETIIAAIKEIIKPDIFSKEKLIGIFIKLVEQGESPFHLCAKDAADIIWDLLSEEDKYKISKEMYFSSIWSNRTEEEVLYYLYKKGFINFTKPKRKGQLYYINRIDDIPHLSLPFAKRVKVNYTNALLEAIIKNNTCSKTGIKFWLEYFFTIPELKKKFTNNPKWMFYKTGWSKLIDYYPEEARMAYLNELLEKYKLTRDKSLKY